MPHRHHLSLVTDQPPAAQCDGCKVTVPHDETVRIAIAIADLDDHIRVAGHATMCLACVLVLEELVGFQIHKE